MQTPSLCGAVLVHANNSSQVNGQVFDSSKPLAAMVTAVHDNGEIAVTVFPPGKEPIALYSIPHVSDCEPGTPYWEWPIIEKKEDAQKREVAVNKEGLTDEAKKNLDEGIKAVLDFGTKATDRAPSDDEQKPVKEDSPAKDAYKAPAKEEKKPAKSPKGGKPAAGTPK